MVKFEDLQIEKALAKWSGLYDGGKKWLLLGSYGSLLDGQALLVVLDVTLEAGDILGSRSDGNARVA